MSLNHFLKAPSAKPASLSPALQAKYQELSERLIAVSNEFGSAITFANSLGAEDMLITGCLAEQQLAIPLFVLETGRLPEPTLNLLAEVQKRWPQLDLHIYYPAPEPLEAWVAQEGINAFYRSIELRKSCCALRKLEPLQRALAGKQAWITGLRRAQSVTREQLVLREWDAAQQLTKINPLFDWEEEEVWQVIRTQGWPYNPLHDQGYPSLGCAPCTRAVEPGADPRSGRWWWEQAEQRECGLHPATRSPAAQ
ncbi:phosphoadenylyl-sulfate reductase [Marinospirillum sp.]|uniref:phosphoadenylyl-sulfate reductase n=1 Tax=Marinospirillum sp. TaxID=2183934 RepID=UPI003A8B8481